METGTGELPLRVISLFLEIQNQSTMKRIFTVVLSVLIVVALAQDEKVKKAPEIKEGDGPFTQLILRSAMLIDGTGAPPIGPVDIVVKQNKITSIVMLGLPTPGVPSNSNRTQLEAGGKELNCEGMYVMPGFVDMHGHIGGGQAPIAEYVFKLWMAHGITTIRDPGSGNGLDWVLDQKNKSAQNAITAPRIKAYTTFGAGAKEPIRNAEQAKIWVTQNKAKGADGIKFFGAAPDIMSAALRENKRLGLRSACHHAQMGVARWNVVHSAAAGLTTMEHWYGLPEAMLTKSTLQNYPLNYNYANEQNRFEEAGRLWAQAAPPFSPKWNAVMDTLLKLDFTLDPTFDTYEATRDLHKARRQEWHETYTLPQLWKFYQPNRAAHGSFWFSWGTEQEVAWKENFRLWMTFVNEYKNRAGNGRLGQRLHFSGVWIWIHPRTGIVARGRLPSVGGNPIGHIVWCASVGDGERNRLDRNRQAGRLCHCGSKPAGEFASAVRSRGY
jgi:hypothetical protein